MWVHCLSLWHSRPILAENIPSLLNCLPTSLHWYLVMVIPMMTVTQRLAILTLSCAGSAGWPGPSHSQCPPCAGAGYSSPLGTMIRHIVMGMVTTPTPTLGRYLMLHTPLSTIVWSFYTAGSPYSHQWAWGCGCCGYCGY